MRICLITESRLPERNLREVYEVNRKLNARGVRIEPLLWKDTFVLIYVYRPRLLTRDLHKEGVAQLLMEYGYEECNVDSCLVRLQDRLSQEEGFPHEIGVFLGYPLQDVIGFINHKGQDCKCCGIWKVYCDEDEARKQFCRMERCTQVYQQVFAKGRTIEHDDSKCILMNKEQHLMRACILICT